MKRTTILLRPEDQVNLDDVAARLGGVSDVEAIRRSLAMVRTLLEWTDEGGVVVLEKGGRRERAVFL